MADASGIVFSHPRLKQNLSIRINPDQITWDYGLNTASFPTYGGEVVQILSVYFGDMTIKGTVSSYRELEDIYGWFITYMQVATQGHFGKQYDQQPVKFIYQARGWHFDIWPKALPGFKYGRDVVAPEWQIVAAVKEPDATFAEQVKDYAAFNAMHKGEFETFGKTTADFGKTGDLENNPWASPDPSAGKDSASVLKKQFKQLGDTFNGFVQAFVQSKLDTLPQFADVSKAADPNFKGLNQVGAAAAAGASGTATATGKKTGSGSSSGSPSSPGSPSSGSSSGGSQPTISHQDPRYVGRYNAVFNMLYGAWLGQGCMGVANQLQTDAFKSLNPAHDDPNQSWYSAAVQDAVSAFRRGQYNCSI